MKSQLKMIAGSSLIYGLGGVSTQILGFLLMPVYCHIIPANEYGKLTYFTAMNNIFAMLIVVGMVSAIYRYFPQAEKDGNTREVLSSAFWFILCMGSLIGAMIWFLAPAISVFLFDDKTGVVLIRVVVLSSFAFSLNSLFIGVLRYNNEALKFIAMSITKTLFALLFNIYTVVILNLGVRGIIFSTMTVELGMLTYLIYLFFPRIKFEIDRIIIRRMFRFGAPSIMASVGSYMLSYTGMYFLRGQESLDIVGQYGFAMKFSTVVMILVIDPFDQAWNPIKFKLLDSPGHDELFSRILDYLVLVSSWLALAISIALPEIVGFLASSDYHPAVKLIPYLSLSVVIYGMYRVSTMGSEVAEKTHVRSFIVLISGGVNLILNYFLVPQFGVVGVISSLLLSYTSLFLLSMAYSQISYYIDYSYKRVAMILIVIIGVYFLSTFLHMGPLVRLPFKLALILCPPFLLYLLRFYTAEEMVFLHRIVQEIRQGRLPRFSIKGMS